MLKKILFIFILLTPALLKPEVRIGQIFINQVNVFDSTQKDWFFAANLANSLHYMTRRYIVEDEILLEEGDYLDDNLVYETERNLRATGLFTNVSVTVDTVNDIVSNLLITTQDKWSTNPSILIGTGGNTTSYGGRIEELNMLGLGTQISLEGLYRSENNTGWQGTFAFNQRRLFRSEYTFAGTLVSNKFRTDQYITFNQPYRTLDTKFSYGISGINSYGSDMLFYNRVSDSLLPFHNRQVDLWFSRAWHQNDRVFVTGLLELNDVDRYKPEYTRAFDNSGKILIAFSSVSEDYYKTTKTNNFQTEDLPIGGWGTAILGKTFAIGSKGESLYYVAAQGEKSYIFGNVYLYGQMTGSSAFQGSLGKYTYEEFFGTGFLRISDSYLFAVRVRQQTVWNWDKQRQLLLDNASGLRGYPANQIQGDNRVVSNFELRMFPDFRVWILNVGGALFYDLGSAWRQSLYITKTQWHSSVGFGFRIQNMKDTGPNSLFRIDFAYNLDERKFAEIIFTSDQLFSAFAKHTYKLPQIYGLDFDYE